MPRLSFVVLSGFLAIKITFRTVTITIILNIKKWGAINKVLCFKICIKRELVSVK